MGDKTGISWTDATWNPIRGCSRVSEGCRHCYAETMAGRIVRMGKGKPTPYDGLVKRTANGPRWTGKVALDAKKLAEPLRWRKPRVAFVNSMSDLFHESLTNEQIAAVFGVMAACPQHTFQVLTKRSKRMREWDAWLLSEARRRDVSPSFICQQEAYKLNAPIPLHDVKGTIKERPWPLRNVWRGVSVENQEAADERIPDLLATPAAVRFISAEPLLGPVDIIAAQESVSDPAPWLDWVIAGCESGPGARPCEVEWLRSLRDQCAAAEVPFFLKQATQADSEAVGGPLITPGAGSHRKPGGIIELPYLDGVQYKETP